MKNVTIAAYTDIFAASPGNAKNMVFIAEAKAFAAKQVKPARPPY